LPPACRDPAAVRTCLGLCARTALLQAIREGCLNANAPEWVLSNYLKRGFRAFVLN